MFIRQSFSDALKSLIRVYQEDTAGRNVTDSLKMLHLLDGRKSRCKPFPKIMQARFSHFHDYAGDGIGANPVTNPISLASDQQLHEYFFSLFFT
ncbi:MAG: hypothetical protein Q8M08_09475 [Bacteroidales bacterium]|nr:hypothetical protein [Bacteroidales bacterium]